jgi:hypothetical protein
LELAASLGGLDEGGIGHNDVLGSVVVLGAFTLVFGGLDFGFLVSRVQILNDIGVELLDFLFKG